MSGYQITPETIKIGNPERSSWELFFLWLQNGAGYLPQGIYHYINGFSYWRIWLYMGFADIRRRYRRSLLGPFWVTLSLAIFIGSMGLIFPALWHTDVKTYLPFFSSGFIIWTFFSTMITESCGAFLDAAGLLKQISLPYVVYSNVVVVRNFLIMLHHSVVYITVMIIFHVPVNSNTLLLIPALLILCFAGSWISILLGLLSLRFRDIRQIVISFLQVTMFVTPIFWAASQLGSGLKAKLLVNLNPLYHFVEIARAPLLGLRPAAIDWVAALFICALGWLITMRILGKYYRHLVFWL